MSNKRVSELNELLSAQIATDDLFMIADVSAIESKKITAANLASYVTNNGGYTGSFKGTASWAVNSDTASYLLYAGRFNGSASYAISCSYALSASYASWALTASHALVAISASYARSSSYASHALTASYAFTASMTYADSCSIAAYSKTASYLLYTDGFMNGTASAAMSSSWSRFAVSSSHLIYTGNPNGTASYAMTASLARSASFLDYNGTPNGTASYSIKSVLSDNSTLSRTASLAYRLLNQYAQSPYNAATILGAGTTASFGTLLINPSDITTKATRFEFWGDVMFPITSSGESTASYIEAYLTSSSGRETLQKSECNSIFSMSGALASGSIKLGYHLLSETTLSGSYEVNLLAWRGALLVTSSRAARYRIETQSDNYTQTL